MSQELFVNSYKSFNLQFSIDSKLELVLTQLGTTFDNLVRLYTLVKMSDSIEPA